jgi:high-affinity nickel-transport protein
LTETESKLRLGRSEGILVAAIFAAIILATVIGSVASTVVARTSTVLAGLVIVAFTFGLRHGMDADHIAAIDNITRKLINEGRRPLTVGTWFSLGHSTVVLVMVLVLVVATKKIIETLPFIQEAGAVLGTAVSGAFLWLIGLMNLLVAVSLYRVFRGLRQRKNDGDDIEKFPEAGGLLSRYFARLFRTISDPWKSYFVGVLFGVGFDTASEIALIAISVGVGVSGTIPIWMVLLLPFMFTCGMVLVDTADGVAMRLAYGWALITPLRKVYYNLTITVISVLVALAIGTVELLQVASLELKPQGVIWSLLGGIDFETLGFVVVGVFAATWLVSLANWRLRNYDKQGLF